MAVINGTAANNFLFGTNLADYINGNGGNDLILGLAGDDEVNGGQGNDILLGGAGNDKFVFDANSGNDIIWDFTKGSDKIDIDPSIYGNVSDILSNITYQNGNAKIDLGGGNNIYVKGLTPNNPLTKDDFVQYTVIDFEDLNSTSSGTPLPDSYQGFEWKLDNGANASHQDDPSVGYGVMGTNLIYNTGGATSVTISKTDGSSFDFEGVDLISAIAPNQDIDIFGYLGGVLVGSTTVSLTNTAVTEVDVDWTEIDTLILDPQLASGNYFAMDNFDFVV
ncbi:MAG: hypothetical protein PQ612_00875 [Rickettsiales bacterium]|nr:hypothetical protein [Pseudomonadota bacterium]MDA0965532.1 hypothetical protein [Pseudomonadota bacterium]MDG4542856.1 hypothetical protein [Rickettsiales bacterium]MDG4544696.1 hypothetical protein [Rickettsiales bacterium]MDG4546818.1 hypothetical protein [Rickettsiales bacterium]